MGKQEKRYQDTETAAHKHAAQEAMQTFYHS